MVKCKLWRSKTAIVLSILKGVKMMAEHELKNTKFDAHVDAIEKHKALLEKLHLDSNTHLDEVNNSIEQLTLTLEEYLKVIGIP
jgi:hypothetical protein